MKRRAIVLSLFLAGCSQKPAPKATPTPPASAEARYEEAKRALSAGRLDEAEARFVALDQSPKAPGEDPALRANVLFALASIRSERGDGKGAVAYAGRAVALRADDPEAQAALATIAHEAGDRAAERKALTALVELDPDALDRRLQLAGVIAAAEGPEASKDAFLAYEGARIRIIAILGKDPDVSRRRAAARRLAAASDAGTARALVLAMTDRDPGVREAAVRSVATIGLDIDPEVRPALKRLAQVEKSPEVQTALTEALAAPIH